MNAPSALLLLPLIAIIAWLAPSQYSERVCRIDRTLPLLAALIFLVVVATGLSRREAAALRVHTWCGHLMVIAIWLFAPFSAGVVLRRDVRKRPGSAVSQLIVLFALLALVMLSSLTGYLGPSHFVAIGEETRNRFALLHLIATPVLIATLLCVWRWQSTRHALDRPGEREKTPTPDLHSD